MKLWTKISLTYSMVLIAIVAVCSAVLLGQVQRKMLSVALGQAQDRQWELSGSFEDMVNRNYSGEDSETVRHTLIYYCFSQYADSSSVLVVDGKTVYSESNISPKEYFVPKQDEFQQQHFFGKIDGRHILIVGSTILLAGYADHHCVVYVVEDITPIYEDMARQLLQFTVIDVILIAGGLLLVIFFVRRFVKPFTELQAAASRIAAGHYRERTTVRTNDEIGMQSVLVNLVENAAKASGEGQNIVLAAYGSVLEVRDFGTGIRTEEVKHVTELFYTVDKSRSKKRVGVGLGLALAEEIVRAHKGRLEIESTYGLGTTVRVRLQNNNSVTVP